MSYYKAFYFWLLYFSQIITHLLEIEETNKYITFIGRSRIHIKGKYLSRIDLVEIYTSWFDGWIAQTDFIILL